MWRLHSWLAYPVITLGLATLGYATLGLLGKRPYRKLMWDLASGFTVSLYAQILVGFFLIFATTNRFFTPKLGLHMVLTMVAAVLAQMTYSANRRKPREERRYSTHVWGVAAALLLVTASILVIRSSIFG